MEKNISPGYAFYFGLSIDQFRKWIEIQFTEELNWNNFGRNWQFEHIVPVAYFDFSVEQDLRLCWNFINIRVEKIDLKKNRGNQVNIITARPFFDNLYHKTGYQPCLVMVEKLKAIEIANTLTLTAVEDFLIENKSSLEIIATFSKEEFNSLNAGMSIQDILLEREILKKFG